MRFNIVKFATGTSTATAYIDGKMYSVTSGHRLFDRIVNKLETGDESVLGDFNLADLANAAFHKVTEKVSVRNGRVYMNEEPVDHAMSKVVVNYLLEGNDDALPLVRFLEKLDENPSFHSRTQFWRFVKRHGLHIADDGDVIMYKGVIRSGTGYKSRNSGVAYVNGVKQNGQIHTQIGDVVSMPRRDISDDPGTACHAGLHCGAKSYASEFAELLITVKVNPAHVVSVPSDEQERKIRVEQYRIMPEHSGDHDTVRWATDIVEPPLPTPGDEVKVEVVEDGVDHSVSAMLVIAPETEDVEEEEQCYICGDLHDADDCDEGCNDCGFVGCDGDCAGW